MDHPPNIGQFPSHAATATSVLSFVSPLLSATGIGTAPPGESAFRAVRISTPSAVTKRVCSAKIISTRNPIFAAKEPTKLRSPLPVLRGTGPVIRPRLVPMCAQRDHRLDGEAHAFFCLTDSLVLGVVRNVRRAVE